MTSVRLGWIVGLICLGWAGPRPAAADDAVAVEPGELGRRPDLVGRELIVDDRIKYFLETRRGQGYDELLFKRTEVPFKLLAGSRFARPPSEPNAVARGTLKLVDGHLIFEVFTLELLPGDVERLDQAVARLRPDDFAGKRSWALWAEKRARELNDAKLGARGTALEADALWVEAGRPGADPIALADAAADRPIPREIREALYLRGFAAAAGRAATAAALDDLSRRVEAVFPHAAEPTAGAAPGLKPGDDPGAAYRAQSDEERARTVRQLDADLIEKSIAARLAEDPAGAVALVDEAARRLPDRPALADRLRQRGLAEAERGATSMRQAEVEKLAQALRDSGQPDRARRILEEWLRDRRKTRLSPTDAEGRVLLAANYEKLIGDRATAGELLAEADAIDPGSRAITDAFLRLGYRKGEAGWHDPTAEKKSTDLTRPVASPSSPDGPDPVNSLRGLTQAQARSRMGGKPDKVVRSGTQGMVVEQWIYRTGRSDQYILFRVDSGTTEPRVSASYSVTQSPLRP